MSSRPTLGVRASLTVFCPSVNGSTATESLTQAFMALHLNATLPGLQSKLLDYANLTVLPTTGRTNNMVRSSPAAAERTS